MGYENNGKYPPVTFLKWVFCTTDIVFIKSFITDIVIENKRPNKYKWLVFWELLKTRFFPVSFLKGD